MSDVLEKIRRETPKKSGPLARTRTRARAVNPEHTEKLSDLLAPHLPAAVKAWIDGLKANKIAWNPDTRSWEETDVPDHDVRRKIALHIFEYIVGKPIERSMEVTGSYKELSQVLEELRQSPEAARLLSPELFETLQTAAEGKESSPTPDSEKNPDSEQNTG